MERLNIEIKDVTQLLSAPPDELVAPGKQRRQELKERADERTRINAKIKNMVAAFSSIPADDKETRTELYAQIKKLRDEEAALADDGDAEPDYRHEELDALVDWWDDLYRKAVHFPAKGKKPDQETFFSNVVVEERTPKGKIILWGDDGKQVKKEEVFAVVDPHMINEALHTLGAKIEMTWNNDPVTLRDGRKESRFDLDILQYKLGSQGETLTGKKLPIFRSVRAAAPCNDTPAAGRSDNRTDTD
jgi:hypothetical protein